MVIVYVYDKDHILKGVVDVYTSLEWVERYNKPGEFSLESNTINNIINTIELDDYLMIESSSYEMIVEDIVIKVDSAKGKTITVTGRSLESILDRRVIAKEVKANTYIPSLVYKYLRDAFITPEDEERKVPGFSYLETTDPYIKASIVERTELGSSVLSVIESICQTAYIGFRLNRLDDNTLQFEFFNSVNRSFSQISNPYVTFKKAYENISSLNYTESVASYKNVVLVGGEGEGATKKMLYVASDRGVGVGIHRREGYIEASINENKENDADLAKITSDLTIEDQMYNKGKEHLSTVDLKRAFEGEIDATRTYIYNKDFFIGDIVQLIDEEHNIEGSVRVEEVILSWGDEGFSLNPTFVSVDSDKNIVGTKLRLAGEFIDGRTYDTTFGTQADMERYIDAYRNDFKIMTAEAPRSAISSADNFFSNLPNLEELYVGAFFVNELVSANCMFSHLPKIEVLDITNFATPKLKYASKFIHNCAKLTNIIMPNLNTINVRDMSYFISSCPVLESVDGEHLNTSSCHNFSWAFSNLASIKTIDLAILDILPQTVDVEQIESRLGVSGNTITTHIDGYPSIIVPVEANIKYSFSRLDTYSTIRYLFTYAMPAAGVTGYSGKVVEDATKWEFTVPNNSNIRYCLIQLADHDEFGSSDDEDEEEVKLDVEKVKKVTASSSKPIATTTDNMFVGNISQGQSYAKSDLIATKLNATTNRPPEAWFIRKPSPLRLEGSFIDGTLYDMPFADIGALCAWTAGYTEELKTARMSTGELSESGLQSIDSAFEDCVELLSVELYNFDGSKLVSMDRTFKGCTKLTSVIFTDVSTPILKIMTNLFEDCESLVSVDINALRSMELNTVDSMFKDCVKLKTINMNKLYTTKTLNFSWMMYNCPEVVTLDISDWIFGNQYAVTDAIFADCDKLTTVYVSNQQAVDKISEDASRLPDGLQIIKQN